MPHKSLRLTAVALAASLGLLAGGCATPASQAGPATIVERSTPLATIEAPDLRESDTTAQEATGPEAPAEEPAASAPGVTVRPATGALAEATPRPVSLDIAGTDISVDVIDVGIASDNEMEIPDSFYEAGWYRYGPAPGASAGNAVLAAHIDIGTEVMPFTQLKDVALGTIITVGRENAEPVQYRVTDVRHVPKATLDTSQIFQRDGEHRLMILTCGGDWLVDKDDYEDNVVLTASPL
ncbi:MULTISPECIES: class F sortase [unclassified Arthrobacter]|uniref:class F sortase n=1 Tax=unclassified Arthrobacter TaxID=235627 RepID=UPI001CE2A6DB|nr:MULTISPECIES: class F sortase [unclassified Arthrobacter]